MTLPPTIQPFTSSGFLVTSRKFPVDDPDKLEVILSKMYLEIAYTVNNRTIGSYQLEETNTGQHWPNPTFGDNPEDNNLSQLPAFRQVYLIPAILPGVTEDIPHNIFNLNFFTNTYGQVLTNVPDYRHLPHASATLATDQIQFTITPSSGSTSGNIIIVNGSTAPAIVSGYFVLEYVLNTQ